MSTVNTQIPSRERLIFALDVPNLEEALFKPVRQRVSNLKSQRKKQHRDVLVVTDAGATSTTDVGGESDPPSGIVGDLPSSLALKGLCPCELLTFILIKLTDLSILYQYAVCCRIFRTIFGY